jgi:hypothetical protein
MGSIENISWISGKDPSSSMMKSDKYTGPDFPGCGQGVIPVFPVTRQFEYQDIPCSRTQFPLRSTRLCFTKVKDLR